MEDHDAHPMMRERSEFGDNRSYHSRGSRSLGLVSSAASGEFNYGDEPEIDYDSGATVLYRCIEGKDWDGALSRLELAPVEAKTWVSRREMTTDKVRWRLLPIHAVCIFRAPLALIEALIEVYEDGAKKNDDQGMLPIHLACRNGASKGVVLTLLQAFPQALEARDRKGRLPVDLVQSSNSQNKENVLVAIRKFQKENLHGMLTPVPQNPPPKSVAAPSPKTTSIPTGKIGEPTSAVATTSNENHAVEPSASHDKTASRSVEAVTQREVDYEHRTLLFRMILKKDWKQAAARAAAYPEEAATWIVTKGFNGNLRFLPLHKACVLSPPEAEFGELLKAFPAAAESADQDGWLPLHCACFYGAPASVMNHLLKTYPRAASHKDDEGRLPLHYACLKGASPEVVEALLKVSAKAAMAKDQEGRLALHHACSKGAPEAVIDALLKASPKGAQSKDDQGRLALHHACRRNSSERVIRTLLRVYPRATQIKDDQDKLAVHYACNHGGSLETIQLLMNTYPESINVRNGFGHTPLAEVEALKDDKMKPVLKYLKEFKKDYDLTAADNDVESQVTLLKQKVSSLEKALEQFVNISTDLKTDLKKSRDPNRVLDDYAEKLRDVSVTRSKDAESRHSLSNIIVPSNPDHSVAHTSLGNSNSTDVTPGRVRTISKPRSRSRSRGRSSSRSGTPGKMRLFRRGAGK